MRRASAGVMGSGGLLVSILNHARSAMRMMVLFSLFGMAESFALIGSSAQNVCFFSVGIASFRVSESVRSGIMEDVGLLWRYCGLSRKNGGLLWMIENMNDHT